MWCDNCLLILPLRAGAIAWGVFLASYNLGGSIFLFKVGQYFFFVFPEWQIYGGIGMGVAVAAILNIIAISNKSYIWTRVLKFLWPFIIVICGVRAIIMIYELHRGREKIIWECQNGGQLWPESANAGYGNTTKFPDTICGPGIDALWTAFIVSLLVDLGVQMYMLFLNWRFTKRLEHYGGLQGPSYSPHYGAQA